MSIVQINTDPSRRQLNQFGFIWMGFVAFFGGVASLKFHNQPLAYGLWIAAVVVPVIGWLAPPFMRAVFVGMSYVAWPIGFVVSHVVLAAVYYAVLTPIGLVMRIVGYDPMKRRFEPDDPTYWVTRPDSGSSGAKSYFRQF